MSFGLKFDFYSSFWCRSVLLSSESYFTYCVAPIAIGLQTWVFHCWWTQGHTQEHGFKKTLVLSRLSAHLCMLSLINFRAHYLFVYLPLNTYVCTGTCLGSRKGETNTKNDSGIKKKRLSYFMISQTPMFENQFTFICGYEIKSVHLKLWVVCDQG